ncbi:MAG TPA: histidine kinase dimerization/phospho-acceptor domain-containing protein, partial [Gemmatimonadota bacterium]|nr:histidine kinase dimerization/phospho-acceptor domain-containing protein [Gemmatimonadota bacterium]
MPTSDAPSAAFFVLLAAVALFVYLLYRNLRAGRRRATDLELLLEADPNMICVVRQDSVTFANRALRERCGRSLAQFEKLARVRNGDAASSFQIELRDDRGHTVPVILHAHPIQWRGAPAWRYELVDISERRESEREVREMMVELRRMTAELENANRLQTEFLSNTSHELKTPLTSIIANAEILEYEMCGPVNAEQRRILTNISRNSQHLLKMITSLLAYASHREGDDVLRLQEVAVGMLLETVVETIKPLLEEG